MIVIPSEIVMSSEIIEIPDNPFILVYNALWETVKQNDRLSQWISPGNRIDYSENLDPKSEISDADLPELSLESMSLLPRLQNTSSTSECVRTYTWVLATGNFDINSVFNQISWELLCSVLEWQTILCSLKWKNKSFVKEVRGLTSTEGTSLIDENKNIRGWAGSWPIEVDMHFLTRDLRLLI